jgi:hypothetical protein
MRHVCHISLLPLRLYVTYYSLPTDLCVTNHGNLNTITQTFTSFVLYVSILNLATSNFCFSSHALSFCPHMFYTKSPLSFTYLFLLPALHHEHFVQFHNIFTLYVTDLLSQDTVGISFFSDISGELVTCFCNNFGTIRTRTLFRDDRCNIFVTIYVYPLFQ